MGISEARTTQTRHSCRGANFTLTTVGAVSRSMEEDILAGLKSTPKTIPAKYLYDAEGSRLFDRICGLPEYYLTRTETAILKRHADEILTRIGQKLCVIELGAGACHKGRLLLESGNVSTFVPVDISTAYLRSAGLRIAGSFPYISVHAVAMDFLAALSSLELLLPHDGRRLLFYAGSSIGNFDPSDACRVLGQFGGMLRLGEMLLIGYDLRKNPAILRRAYNDSRGVTAAFNLNLLVRFNRELRADFDLSAFRHVALYNDILGRIEMHLESVTWQAVKIGNERISFDARERIHTENSYKYSVAEFDAIAAAAGFGPVGLWMDPAAQFAVGLFEKRDSSRFPQGRESEEKCHD